MEFECFTDGGSQGGRGGTSAAIIRNKTGGEIKIAAYLGDATNNEAEIIGLLLALAFLRNLNAKEGSSGVTPIKWVADSEYTIKSATEYIHNWQKNGWRTASKEPVKNQGLWKSYLHLNSGFSLKPNHVRGHTGHPENEACDLACQWLRAEHERLAVEEGKPIELSDGLDSAPWVFVDARGALEAMRTVEQPGDDITDSLPQLLSSLGLDSFQAVATVGTTTRQERDTRRVQAKIEELKKFISETAIDDSVRAELMADLDRLRLRLRA